MSTVPTSSKGLLEIRKYSNRRYYDATRSRHLTLEEIRNLIREGYDIRVTDNQTSADITAKMLTQIILDLDAPKLELFPTSLLAQLIRVNDHLVKGFYQRFFHQALDAFLDYQRLVESQLKQGSMLPAMFPPLAAWTQAVLKPFANLSQTEGPAATAVRATENEKLAAELADLQRQMEDLRKRTKGKRKPGRRKS
jgi:polyhydroxyalkanoate synthesis repressor PhaR